MDKPNSKLIMTLREWIEYEMPYNEYFFNCSGCGHLDMNDYKWPRFGDPLINEPIGVSIGVTLPMLYSMNKHMKNQGLLPVKWLVLLLLRVLVNQLRK